MSHSLLVSSRERAAQRGFTLIEILVVMVIIGILATLSIGSFQSSQQKARDAQRKSDLRQISNSLEAYYNDKGKYPLNSIDDHSIMGCANQAKCSWGSQFSDENNTIYMVQLPADPKDTSHYYYESDGTYYELFARLENNLDDSATPPIAGDPANYGISCGTYGCNYGIASQNHRILSDKTPVKD